MSTQPLPHPDHDQPPDPEPDTIATPEGDNEFPPDVPLPASSIAPIRPRGDQAHTKEPLYPALDQAPPATNANLSAAPAYHSYRG